MPAQPKQKPYKFVGIDGKKFSFRVYDPVVPTAIYVRISQDRNTQGHGVTRQLKDCAAYAAMHGLTVIEVIEENDTSAYVAPHDETKKPRKIKRPGFEHLLNIARSGEVHAVVAWATDRLWRSVRDLDRLINIVETTPHKFTIHAIKGGVIGLDDPNGQVVARILGAVAQGEVDIKSVRQSRAQKQAFDDGKFPGGRLPFGYNLGAKEGELIVNELQKDVLLDVADGILRDGWSITEATRYIRKELPNRCGKMKPIALRGILTGPTVAAKRHYVPVKDRASGNTEGEWGPASWEAIFDDKTWRLLQGALKKKSNEGRPRRISLLAGLLICARCGGSMGYSAESYKCSVTSGCGRMGITTKNVEPVVTEFVTTLLSGAENQRMLKRLLGIGDGPPGAGSIDIEGGLLRLAKQRAELTGLYRAEQLPLADLSSLLAGIKDEEQALLKQRDDDVSATLAWERANMAFQTYEALLGKTDDDSLARLNLVFRAVLDGVVVSTAKKGPTFDANRLLFRGAGSEPYIPLDDRVGGWDEGIVRWSNEIADDAEQPTGRDLVEARIVGVPVPRDSGRKATESAHDFDDVMMT